LLRSGRNDDSPGIIALIGACWAEYPGVILDIEGEAPELLAPVSYYETKGGALWVAPEMGQIVGTIATAPLDETTWEISRLYVARPHRGTGLAQRLLDTAEAHARHHGARRARLWSDTRFRPAHRFYEKRSYVRVGPLRNLADRSNSLEFCFAKPLAGLAALSLGPAAAASAARVLSRLSPRPSSHWRALAADIATGSRALIVAWSEGVIAGSLELPDRLTTPAHPPEPIARALLAAAERVAEREDPVDPVGLY
jgi:GNAT superfamily N-acetyltransferase